MNKKIRELRQLLTNKVKEARDLTEEGKIEDATKITDEAESLKEQIEKLEKLNAIEQEMSDDIQIKETVDIDKKPEARSVLIKALKKESLTSEERAMLKEGIATSPDVSGAYIVPEDVQTEINEYKRQYKSMKDMLEVQSTTTNAGSFVYENGENLTELADLTEGELIPEQVPDFAKREYKIKDKGALLPITNQLLNDEAGGLISYIGRWFSRKAVKTENKDIFKVLKEAKTATEIENIEDIKNVINVELDPELEVTIVTNQSGFNYLDKLKDTTGRPLLQPDPTSKTSKLLDGIRIDVFSNRNLPNEESKFPILVGDFFEAAKFMERQGYELATSKEAGFKQNISYLRAIERYDVVLKDKDAYQYLVINDTVESAG